LQFLQFGNLTIPLHWLLTLAALLSGWTMVKIYIKYHKIQKESLEVIGNSLFIWGMVWKLSIVFFDFETVKAYPLSIAYFSGGEKGYFLGLLVSAGYIVYKSYKQRLWYSLGETVLLFGTLSYGLFLLFHGFVEGEGILTLLSYAFITILFVIWLWQPYTGSGLPQKAGTVLIVFGLMVHLPGETKIGESGLVVAFSLLSIFLHNRSLKKEGEK